MEFPETNGKSSEYHDVANLTYISNIAQLERQLQTIELAYMSEKAAAAAADQGSGDDDTAAGGKAEEATVDCPANDLRRLQSVTRGVYNLVKSNVGLLLLLLVYSLLGAAIFSAIEGRDAQTTDNCDEVRNRLVKEIMNVTGLLQTTDLDSGLCKNNTSSGLGNVSTCRNRSDAEKFLAEVLLKPYEECLSNISESKSKSPGKNIQWNYSGALYFCVTVFTTVGYGNISPKTKKGKVATMIYAAIGIPLCLVVLSKLGKSLTRFIKFFWSYVRRFYYTGSFQRVRRMIPVTRFRRSMLQRFSDHVRRSTIRLRRRTRVSESDPCRAAIKDPPGAGAFVPYEVNDTFNLPPIVAIAVAFLYTVIGTLLYSSWEEWSYLEAFYFTYTSLCTIGFGDIVPDHTKFFLASSVYLLFGLALVAMVINVVMEAVTDTINMATETVMTVGERIIQCSPRQLLHSAEGRHSLDENGGQGVRRKSV